LHAGHMPVMVGAPDINGLVKAAHGKLVVVVGDIGREISRDPVGAHKHFILGLFLAVRGFPLVGHTVFRGVLGAFVHDRAVLGLVAGAGGKQLVHHGLHGAGLVQVAFMEPDVVFDAVFAEIALQTGNVFGQSKIGDCLFQRFEIAVNISVAVLRRKVFGVLDNVGALVDRKSTRLNSSHVSISYAV